jgi:hypothetical protein
MKALNILKLVVYTFGVFIVAFLASFLLSGLIAIAVVNVAGISLTHAAALPYIQATAWITSLVVGFIIVRWYFKKARKSIRDSDSVEEK